MTDTVTSQKLADGDRNVIYHFTNISDGTGESGVTKVDVSGLNANTKNGAACAYVSIESITFSCSGMGVQILEDATADVLVAALPPDTSGAFYYDEFGGIVNSKAAGYNGDILFTTVGALSGDTYSITMKMRKHYA